MTTKREKRLAGEARQAEAARVHEEEMAARRKLASDRARRRAEREREEARAKARLEALSKLKRALRD